MSPLNENPFAILTAVVAPAVLTNAASVLCLGTSNRIARVVDRTRVVAAEIACLEVGSAEYKVWVSQLERLRVRARLLFSPTYATGAENHGKPLIIGQDCQKVSTTT